MVKFFKKGPEKCSICLETKMVYKKMNGKGHKLNYCRECYDKYYARIEVEVRRQVDEMVKAKRLIGLGDTMALTKKISAQITEEDMKAAEEKEKTLQANKE